MEKRLRLQLSTSNAFSTRSGHNIIYIVFRWLKDIKSKLESGGRSWCQTAGRSTIQCYYKISIVIHNHDA